MHAAHRPDLGARPHVALSACRADGEPYQTILEILATLLAWDIPVDLARLYGWERSTDLDQSAATGRITDPGQHIVRVAVRGQAFAVPQPNSVASTIPRKSPPQRGDETDPESAGSYPVFREETTWFEPVYQAQHATAEAHRAFLRTSQQTAELMGRLIAFQFGLLQCQSDDMQATEAARASPEAPFMAVTSESLPAPAVVAARRSEPDTTEYVFGRVQCREFAVGSIAALLGPDYAAVDAFPTRVRLPDEPLLLVDRIVTIEGQPRSLQEGRVVTEHLVKPDAWYLDAGKVPACIAIEAGQADLFLSAYLAADFVTEGRAVYRLLDATVTFHRGLPGPGDVIRYDIRITRFFRQGDTILFRFQFDATVNGQRLLTMRDGCAGFFSAEELAAGKGVVARQRGLGQRLDSSGEPPSDLVPMTPTELDVRQVDALRHGDLFGAFGAPFERLAPIDLVRLPKGRMVLLHRVSLLDPKGGPDRLGLICAEADIGPSDWFLVCHFVDDRVMPGTLMYESCLHALRILLMRIGWVGPCDQVAFEPALGIGNRLRCRGQVVEFDAGGGLRSHDQEADLPAAAVRHRRCARYSPTASRSSRSATWHFNFRESIGEGSNGSGLSGSQRTRVRRRA